MESGTRNGSEELLPAHVKCNAKHTNSNNIRKATSRTKQTKKKRKQQSKYAKTHGHAENFGFTNSFNTLN